MDIMENKQKTKICLNWIVVVLYLAVIFYFSSQDATKSHVTSSRLLEYLDFLIVLIPEFIKKFASFVFVSAEAVLRKAAHFTEYLILALVFYKAVFASGVKWGKSVLITFVFCLLYAVSDEVHQLFVPGRAFQITDILIDAFGASVGIGIIYVKKHISKHEYGEKEA